MKNFLVVSVLFFVTMLFLIGCSNHYQDNPAAPILLDKVSSADNLDAGPIESELLGAWTVNFDFDSMSAEILLNRNTATHYNLTTMLSPVITLNSYNPGTGIADVDLKITNPYPFNGYDLRLILYTDAAGHFLENWDDFTSLYDIPGGNIINPFKAFAKNEPNRIFGSMAEHTENLKIYIPSGNFSVQIAVEASFPSNCAEPYSIDNFSQQILEETSGAETQIGIEVSDWQNNVTAVYLYCPIITGGSLVTMQHESGDLWSGILANANGVNAGQYTGYIAAYSGANPLYDMVIIQVSEASTTPAFSNVVTLGSTSYEFTGGLTFDSQDNIYLAGHFDGSVDFDPGPGEYIKSSSTGYDSFLLKLDSEYNFQWVVTFGGVDSCMVKYIRMDDLQNIYMLGEFRATVDFNPGPGEDLHTSAGYGDIFLSKFNASGEWQWSKTYGSPGYDGAQNLDFDSNQNIYISGVFNEQIDFDPTGGTYYVNSVGSQDVYISKFEPSGAWLWAKAWGGTGGEYACDLIVENDSSILVSGTFEFTCDFDPGTGVESRATTGPHSVYISKFDASGNFISVLTFGGEAVVMMSRMIRDSESGFYMAGTFAGIADFDPGPGVDARVSQGAQGIYICRYDSSLNYLWTVDLGGTDWLSSNSLCAISGGGIITSGTMLGSVDFNPGPDDYLLTSNGGQDCYAATYDSEGNFEWAMSWGGSANDSVMRSAMNTNGDLYFAGDFRETVDFDPGQDVDERTSSGLNDIFLSKFE